MIDLRQSLYKSERVFSSGENPLLITCTDYTDWVCKHGRLSPSLLFNELLGSRFAQIWDLRTPEISLINVSIEHLPDEHLNIVQPAYFNKPCFGSRYIEVSQVIDFTLLPSFRSRSFRSRIANKLDLLKLGLFDIWLCNEDRHHGHTNLLLDQTNPAKQYINVFDHGAIFNSNALQYGLALIAEEESIVCSEFTKILFANRNNLVDIVNNIVEDFYLCIENCSVHLSNILNEVPLEWGLNLLNLEQQLRNTLFSVEWTASCEQHFRTMIQANI